ncbi:HAMP domain-containing histidine kinase [Desulfohalobiaceae bacterium Ax17]|uniref:sensor histidine kinase n=1 Tax=Desulfovulcanus ferrireducens TaxID=2831190 RepID=UPI00207BB882|nr:sensor histidine kinase [Desulfovulcanus ferrireducens]MBT8762774.1 HAMP domain-containing histidine kinase [Desulfovulcanus ferrireducens]
MDEINWSILEGQGLKFFGRVGASISHEIKNCLAIINEQNGLLEDFLYLAQQGQHLDIERIKGIVASIARQVERANTIARRLNKFAHSVDETWVQVDLREIVTLVVDLAQRMAAVKGFQLIASNLEPVNVSTQPFILMDLIFSCIDQIMEGRGKGLQISLSCVKQKKQPTVIISEPVEVNEFLKVLASTIEAHISVEQQTKISINKIS